MIRNLKRIFAYISIAVIGLSIVPMPVSAAQITLRSLTLSSSATSTGVTDTLATWSFQFTVPTATAIRSARFQVCTTAAGACVVPAGGTTANWVNTGATLGSTTGLGTGFTVDLASNADSIGVTSTTNVTAPSSPVTIPFNTVRNPNLDNSTFFVRISTYSSDTYTGSLDSGVVAAAINRQIVLTGTMPESLVFCTGASVPVNGGGFPDCPNATSGAVAFDRLFSPVDTSVAISQMAASTNAGSGYNITVNGTTMTSGANTIAAMNVAGVGIRNSSQFGMNLVANTIATSTPAFGFDVAPTSNTTNYRGQPLTGYGTPDTFKFTTGDSVANSGNAVLGPTDSQIYTISYIVNVPGSQPAGTYTTTLTYICTATF